MRHVVTTPASSGRRSRAPRSIGLWGATGCGKTTFLAALYIAVNRSDEDLNIFGVDDTSTEFMVSSNRMLTTEHRFPVAGVSVGSYSWTMNMTSYVQPDRTRFGRQSQAPVAVPSQFNIDLRDAPGGYFASTPQLPGESRIDFGESLTAPAMSPEDMMEYLAGCEGLLLLIDPTRERELGDSHEFFQGTLLRMAQHRMAAMPPGSKLPHYVAVCITKFDDPEVYKFARLNGYRTYDENDAYLFPRVHNDDAESFFRALCDTDMSDADLICKGLRKYFYPDHIRYFVTSAIGFHRKGGRFREDDHDNAVNMDGTLKIRGQIHPINVLEPVLWLGSQVTA